MGATVPRAGQAGIPRVGGDGRDAGGDGAAHATDAAWGDAWGATWAATRRWSIWRRHRGGMTFRLRHPRRCFWRVMILQETWRIDWRTPQWLPLQIVVTLRRWIEPR